MFMRNGVEGSSPGMIFTAFGVQTANSCCSHNQ